MAFFLHVMREPVLRARSDRSSFARATVASVELRFFRYLDPSFYHLTGPVLQLAHRPQAPLQVLWLGTGWLQASASAAALIDTGKLGLRRAVESVRLSPRMNAFTFLAAHRMA